MISNSAATSGTAATPSAGGSSQLLPGDRRGSGEVRKDGGTKNAALLGVLQELGWSHGKLVAALCDVLGRGYVGRSTVSEWVNQSRVPREPLPTVVTHLLSEALGRELDIAELWGGRAVASVLWLTSMDGVGVTWGAPGNTELIADWLARDTGALGGDRRTFLTTWGRRLTDLAWSYVDNLSVEVPLALTHNSGRRSHYISAPMVAICSGVVTRLRRFDDREGGNLANVAFAHKFLMAIGGHLHVGDAESGEVAAQLLRVWMELCQIVGWMAYDAEQHGLAQRYFLSTLHAARALEDSAFGSHALAHLAHQAIYCGKLREATELANAAVEAAKGAPHAQRALVTALLAHTEALSGNAHGFETTMDRAQALIEHPNAVNTKPGWLYWFDGRECLAKRGHGLLALSSVSSRGAAGWLSQAVELLEPKASLDDQNFPREAVYNRLWLARGCMRRGDVDQALRLASPTLVPGVVRSPRSIKLLRALDAEFAARPSVNRLPAVGAFRAEFADMVRAQAQFHDPRKN